MTTPIEQEEWEILFDKGFVWSEAARGLFALFRTMSDREKEQMPESCREHVTIAQPAYIKAFIRQAILIAQAKERERVVEALKKLCNGAKTERGLSSQIGKFIKALNEK